MSSWILSFFSSTPQPDVEKQDKVIEEAHIIKDFYNRYLEANELTCRMITVCLDRCNASSSDANDEIVKYNCMDRCMQKFTETKQVVEEHLEGKMVNRK